MIVPNDCCEFCLDVATVLAETCPADGITTVEGRIETEYISLHAHAHPQEDRTDA